MGENVGAVPVVFRYFNLVPVLKCFSLFLNCSPLLHFSP